MPQPEAVSPRSAPQSIFPCPAPPSESTSTMLQPKLAPFAGVKPGISDHGITTS